MALNRGHLRAFHSLSATGPKIKSEEEKIAAAVARARGRSDSIAVSPPPSIYICRTSRYHKNFSLAVLVAFSRMKTE